MHRGYFLATMKLLIIKHQIYGKKLVSVFCICAYFGLAHAQIPQEIWKESEQIEKQIKDLFSRSCVQH